jgi:preprotein translocase subunit YajC
MRSAHFFASTVIAATKSSSGGAAIAQLFIFALIGLAMYMLLIRPQRKRQRAQTALQSTIEIGDEVMTTSGVYGFVTGFEGDIAWLEIDDNVQIRVARQAIQRKVDTTKGETAVPTDDGTKSRQTKIDDVIVDTTSTDEA